VIAVVGGTGRQGRGIAQRLVRAGHRVALASRDPSRALAATAGWPADARPPEVSDYGDSIRRADVAILAVPFEAVSPLLEAHRAAFTVGTLVIDVTVPLNFGGGKVSMLPVAEGSAAEHIRARLPDGVRLAAAFKTVPAHLLNEIDRPLDCDEFVCGDSEEARLRAIELVRSVEGLRPIDVGPLSRAASIEQLTLLAVAINRRHNVRAARFRVVGI
jgi:NADPH-dependent F420 reductase